MTHWVIPETHRCTDARLHRRAIAQTARFEAQILFGLTATPMYMWLKFSRKILLSVLQDHPAAAVLPPSNEEVDRFADAIASKSVLTTLSL